jgi:YHS domain-containing protein
LGPVKSRSGHDGYCTELDIIEQFKENPEQVMTVKSRSGHDGYCTELDIIEQFKENPEQVMTVKS